MSFSRTHIHSYVLSPHTVDNYVKLYLQTYNKHVKAMRLDRRRETAAVVGTDVVDSCASPSRRLSSPNFSLPLSSSTSISPEKSVTPQSPLRHNSGSSEDDGEPPSSVAACSVTMPCVSRSRESREFNQLRHRFVPSHLFRPGAQPSTVPVVAESNAAAFDKNAVVFLDRSHWRLTDEDCSSHLSQIDYMFDDIACNSLWAHDCCGDYTWAPPYNVLLYVKAMRVIDLLLVESSWSHISYAVWAAAVLYHLIGPTIISVIDFPGEHLGELDRAIIVSAPFVQAVYELGLPQMTALDAKQGDAKVQQRRAAMPYYVRSACERAAGANGGGGGGEQTTTTSCLSPDERNLLELLYAAPKIESSFDVNESTPKLFERAVKISQQMYAARHVVKEKVYCGLFMHMRHVFQEVFDYKPLYTAASTVDTTSDNAKTVDFNNNNKNILTNFFHCDNNTDSILSVPITQPFKDHRRMRQCVEQRNRNNSQAFASRQNSGGSGRKSSASSSSRSSCSPLVPAGSQFALPITPQRHATARNNSDAATNVMSPPLTGFVASKLPISAANNNNNWLASSCDADARLMRRKLQLQTQKTPENFIASGTAKPTMPSSATKNAVESVFTPPDSGGKLLLGSGSGSGTAAARDELNDILQREEAQQNFLLHSRRRSTTTNVVKYSSSRDSKTMRISQAEDDGVDQTKQQSATLRSRVKLDSSETNDHNSGKKTSTLLSVRSTSSEDDVKFVEQRRSLRKVVVLNAATQSAAAAAAAAAVAAQVADSKKMGPPQVPPVQHKQTTRKRRSSSRNSTVSSNSTSTTSNRRTTNNKQMKSDLTQTFLTPAVPPPQPPQSTSRPSATTRAAAAARKAAAAADGGGASLSLSQATQRQAKSNLTLPEMWNMQTAKK